MFCQLGFLSLLVWSVASQTTTRTFTTTIDFWPNGTATNGGSLYSYDPIPCGEACSLILPYYYVCYVLTSTDAIGRPKTEPTNLTLCDQNICTQENYNLLLGCLNCVVANGDERPYGYYTNTSITAYPTNTPGRTGPQNNPNGLLNLDQANGILRNVSARCNAASSAVEGDTTITASPTTTGPYYATWTSGANVDLSIWTGVTQFTKNFTAIVATFTYPTPSSTSSVQGGAGASSTSAAAASASTSGAATKGMSTGFGVGVSGAAIWLGLALIDRRL